MTEGYEIQKLLRVATAVVQDTGLVFTGARYDGRNIGFGLQGADPDSSIHSKVLFNLDHNHLVIGIDDLTMTQYRSLLGIAAYLEIDVVDSHDLQDEVA
jgi:hypothetical protein